MAGFSEALLQWYEKHGRKDLPWQKRLSLYRVWVSEIMLQQTQVKGVIPYYQEFMTRFPTLSDLAAASQDEVLHCWTGLGYYARARNLLKAARQIQSDYRGRFPRQLQQVMDLPGVGRSTAGAILALATNQRHAILDGNVKRVLCRRYAVSGHPEQPRVNAKLWNYAERLTPKTRVSEYTQAIMDLGATVCTRTQPRCDECPVRQGCRARKLKRVGDFPVPKPRRAPRLKTTHFLIMHNDQKQVLLEQRPAQGIWGGLFSFPEVVVGTSVERKGLDNHRVGARFIAPDLGGDKSRPYDSGSQTSRDHRAMEGAIAAECAARFGFQVVRQAIAEPILHKFSHFDLKIIPVHLWSDAAPSVVMDSNRALWYSSRGRARVGLAAPVKQLLEKMERNNDS